MGISHFEQEPQSLDILGLGPMPRELEPNPTAKVW